MSLLFLCPFEATLIGQLLHFEMLKYGFKACTIGRSTHDSYHHTDDKWFGVTYIEDKEEVINNFKELLAQGAYPKTFFE